MQVMNKGSLHDVAKEFAGGIKKDSPAHADFFAPLNEMDPHTRRPANPITVPEFKFAIYHLAGPGCDPTQGVDYSRIMNKVAKGECQLLESNTYHSKDGDIRVFVQWLEFPDGLQKAMEALRGDPNSGVGGVTDSEKKARQQADDLGAADNVMAFSTNQNKKRRRRRKRGHGAKTGCPAPEPKITM